MFIMSSLLQLFNGVVIIVIVGRLYIYFLAVLVAVAFVAFLSSPED